MIRLSALLTVILFTFWTFAACAACDWRLIDPGNGRFTTGTLSLDLGEADTNQPPTAWQGPVTIARQDGGSCTVDPAVGIIERPIFANVTILLISTFSGSNRTIFGVDGRSCKVLWKSRPFTGDVTLHGARLILGRTTLMLQKSCLP